jgi:hypothetical protein
VTTSSLKFDATAGATYYVAVDGFGGASGTVQLALDLLGVQPRPANDDFASPELLSGAPVARTNLNIGATRELNEPVHAGAPGGASVWYSWTAPASGLATVSTYGSSFDTVLAVYTGGTLGALELEAENDDDPNGGTTSLTVFTATAGVTYRFAVDGYNAVTGTIRLELTLTAAAAVPANDLLENATALSGTAVNVNGTNLGATKSGGEPDHAASPGGQSVWWKWTAGLAGAVVLTTSGSSFDTVLAVYTGSAVEALTLVAENDDETVNSRASRVVFEALPGETYQIAVDGYQDSQGTTAAGTIQLHLSFSATPPPPPNDLFADRTVLTGAAPVVTGTTEGGTVETSEPIHANNYGGRSVWWTWTAPVSGVYAISTAGSDFDTLLAVYTGSTIAQLTLVAANDEDGGATGHTSRVVFEAVAGTPYQIAVDGYRDGLDNVASGNVALKIIPLGGPTDLYFTQFETSEGYPAEGATLAGHKGWQSSGSGGNKLVSGFITGKGQQAYVGYNPPAPEDFGLIVWQPLDFAPATNQVVKFSTLMRIVNSGNGQYDNFRWSFYSRDSDRLFSLEFDNYYGQVNVILDDGAPAFSTEVYFDNDTVYELEVLMDYAHNAWSATLNGVLLATSLPISTLGAPNGLGDVDAVWAVAGAEAGDNYMLFDDYRIQTIAALTAPKVTGQPVSQSVNAGGGPVSFTVSATGSAPLAYQWYRNGSAVTNATNATLTLGNIPTNYAGSYAAVVTNLAGADTSLTAILTVNVVIPPPANNNFASPVVLAGVSNEVAGSNVGANKESGEPNHAGKAGGKSVWWRWTAPASGFVTVSTLGSDFDTLLGVYTGSAVGALTTVASNDDGQSRVRGSLLTFNAVSGTTYQIAVDGFNGDDGTIRLSVKPTTTPILGLPSVSPTSGLQLMFTGEPAVTYIIQASSDLKVWTSLTNEFTASGVFQYSDPQATNFTLRFYRAFQEP